METCCKVAPEAATGIESGLMLIVVGVDLVLLMQRPCHATGMDTINTASRVYNFSFMMYSKETTFPWQRNVYKAFSAFNIAFVNIRKRFRSIIKSITKNSTNKKHKEDL